MNENAKFWIGILVPILLNIMVLVFIAGQINTDISYLKASINEIKTEMKRIANLETRVTVIESQKNINNEK